MSYYLVTCEILVNDSSLMCRLHSTIMSDIHHGYSTISHLQAAAVLLVVVLVALVLVVVEGVMAEAVVVVEKE